MNKYVLVTGGAAGIGKALCEEYAKHGYNIVNVDINGQKLKEVEEELKQYHVEVLSIEGNLLNEEMPQYIYDECIKRNIHIDILINNSGIGASGDFIETTWERQESIAKLNNIALMHMCYVFLPDMLKRKNAHICNIASNAGFAPLAPQCVYAASKAFTLSFSQALYELYKGRGVKVTCICPGPTKTDFFKSAGFDLKNLKGTSPEKLAKFIYKKVDQGKPVASHTLSVKIMSVGTRILPRSLVRILAAKIGDSQ